MQRQRSRRHAHAAPAFSKPRLRRVLPSRRALLYTVLLALALSVLLFARTPPPPAARAGVFARGPSRNVSAAARRRLAFSARNLTLDAAPLRLVSGSLHYFRAPPSRWRPLLEYARYAGLNAVETYVPWNLHEPYPAEFRFSGILDLRLFLEIAHDVGLLVLLRPGPYICSEWDLGGLPPYLLADRNVKLRSMHPVFTKAVSRYFDAVHAQIAPYIGRPVVALQLENEFGAYGDDSDYMHFILRQWQRRHVTSADVMFFTSDNGGAETVTRGSPFDPAIVLTTVNFDWQADRKLSMLHMLQPQAPLMVAELWAGWFDHWGEKHHVRDAADVMHTVRDVLFDKDASVNLYMFFGGTNFGFMSGANIGDNMTYQPDTTSYDYDAFITEYGDIRASKMEALRRLLREFWAMMGDTAMLSRMATEPPLPPFMSAYAGTVLLEESRSLYDVLHIVADTRIRSQRLLSMEEAGGDYGFVMYRHNFTNAAPEARELQITGVRDFAYILGDRVMLRTIDRNKQFEEDGHTVKTVYVPSDVSTLDIIVENRGRVNYGQYLHDRKGLLGNVTIDGNLVQDFEIITMGFRQDHPLLRDPHRKNTIGELREALEGRNEHPPLANRMSPPTFFRGEMSINPGSMSAFDGEFPGTHCRIFGRGVLWVNGFNVGRFHTGVPGPQRSLFVPGALLREGRNEFIVLHMNMHLTREPPRIQFFEQPDFGPTR